MILLIKSLQELNADVRTYLDPHCLVLLLQDVDDLQQDLFRLLVELYVRKGTTFFWCGLLALCDELQGLDIAEEEVLLGPAVHIIGHFVRTEVGDQDLLCSYHKLHASQPLEIFKDDQRILLRQSLYN